MSAYCLAEGVFRKTLEEKGMLSHLTKGAVVALSGGKDSVLLLSLFAAYAKEHEIPVFALHVHHGIRGAEADGDAEFCRALCERLSVPFFTAYTDVPKIAKERHEGIEETARKERYRLLVAEAKKRGCFAVLTAHSATDQTETVLLHLLRGGGGQGLCGMPFVRPLDDGIHLLRPLLTLTAEEITRALEDGGLSCVYDRTNEDTALRRNYLRKEILPRLSCVTPSPERSVLRMTENLKEDMALLDAMAEDAFLRVRRDGGLYVKELSQLPYAIGYRVFCLFYKEQRPNAPRPERVHVCALFAKLREGGDFSLSFPGGITLCAAGDVLRASDAEKKFVHPVTPVAPGCNLLADGSYLWLLAEDSVKPPAIVYTLATRRILTFATIEGELYVRSREDGDSYVYGGMTHKLKKLFSDKKIPKHLRSRVPVLCDDRGIVWVPAFGERNDGAKCAHPLEALYLAKENIPEGFSESGLATFDKNVMA